MEALPKTFQPARYVKIKPRKFSIVPYRHKPKTLPDTTPFDFADGLKRVGAYLEAQSPIYRESSVLIVDYLKIRPGITAEEARFWVECFTNPQFQEPRRVPTIEEITEACRQPLESWGEFVASRLDRPLEFPSVCGIALFKLFSLEDFLTPWNRSFKPEDDRIRTAITFGFRLGWLPYLDKKAFQNLQKQLKRLLLANPLRASENESPPLCLEMVFQTGLDAETRPVVQQWLDDVSELVGEKPSSYSHIVYGLIFLLQSPELILHYFRKFNFTLSGEDEFAAWLSNIGLDGLDVLERSILLLPDYRTKQRHELCVLLGKSVVAPELAPFMFQLFQSGKEPRVGRDWLESHLIEAIVGLIGMMEREDPLSEEAASFLIDFGMDSQKEALEFYLSRAQPRVQDFMHKLKETKEKVTGFPISAATDPWFDEFLSRSNTVEALPEWCALLELPHLTIDGQPLERPLVVGLLARLRKLTVENYFESLKDPSWSEIGRKLDNTQLNEFLWSLFEMWQRTKPDWKDQWVLLALGIWGNDHTAMKLATAIQNWPSTGKLNRAEAALDVLGVIGTPTSISYVQRHALGHLPRVFSKRSKAVYERIAAERGLSTFELDDRIVPEAGLDRHCRRVLDFGPRQFTATLTPELKPVVLDAKGKKKRGLPAIEEGDDPVLAATAAREWPLFVEQITLIRDVQPRRFERAQMNGRNWLRDDFEKYVLGNPVTGNLTKHLIWRAFSKDGEFIGTFRVSEDDSYSDSHDKPFPMPEAAVIRLAHRLHFDETERARWLQLFSDYFISQPFPQLDRTVIPPSTVEISKDRITGIPDLEVQPDMNEITGKLLLLGWGLAPMQEPTKGKYFWRFLDFAKTWALAGFSFQTGPGFSFKEFLFMEGEPHDTFSAELATALPLKNLDPVLVSETLVELRTATNKGK